MNRNPIIKTTGGGKAANRRQNKLTVLDNLRSVNSQKLRESYDFESLDMVPAWPQLVLDRFLASFHTLVLMF